MGRDVNVLEYMEQVILAYAQRKLEGRIGLHEDSSHSFNLTSL